MKRFSLALALVVGTAAMSQLPVAAPVPSVPAHFVIVLTTTQHGWAARCDTGCAWRQLTFSCDSECHPIITKSGVFGHSETPVDSSGFDFALSRSAKGGRATGRSGVTWLGLSWNCRTEPCKARLDEFGVHTRD